MSRHRPMYMIEILLRHRIPVIGLIVVLTLFFGWHARRVTLNGDFATYLDQSDPVVAEYNEIGAVFGSNATGIILVTAGDVFEPEVVNVVERLTESIGDVGGVDDVLSLTNVVDFRRTGFGLEVTRLLDPTHSTGQPDEIRDYVLSEERYRGSLVSEDGTATAILVRYSGDVNQYLTAMRVHAESESAAPAATLPEGTDVYLGGMPFLVYNMTLMIVENLRILVPLMILVLVTVLLVGFRHWAGVVFPLLVVGVSVIWTLGSDYTFEDGTYANAQWVHGFSTERGGSLNDYGFAYVEQDIFGDDLRIRLGGAVEFGHTRFDPTGFGLLPELTWQAIDNFELELGAFFLDGGDTTEGVLGAWKDADQVFLRTTVHF